MAATASDKFQDNLTAHSVDVLGFEAGLQKKVLAILKRLETDLVTAIAKVDVGGVSATTYRKARLKVLLEQTRTAIRTAYREASTDTRTQLYGFAKAESSYVASSLNKSVGLDLATVALSPELLRELAKGTLIQGAASHKWWTKQARNTEHRFELAMQQGVAQGEPLGKLIQRIRGTKENKYTDGIMVASRREAQTLVRTSVQATANAARESTYKANDDIIRGLVWVSTMDTRTSPICIARSGKEYTLNHRPVGHDIPWGVGPGKIHWNCRSTSIPVLKSWNELGAKGAIRTGGRPSDIRTMFTKQLEAQGMSAEQIAAAKMNMKAALGGQVPVDISFETWLGKKPDAFQNRLLGVGKAELFRSGKLALPDLLDQRGRVRTLEQLQLLAEQIQRDLGAAIVGPSGLSKRAFFMQSLDEQIIKKLTDEELQAIWDAEFPAEQFGTRYLVKDIRASYNRGAFGKLPAEPVHTYGKDGEIIKRGVLPKEKPPKPPPPIVEPPPPPYEPPIPIQRVGLSLDNKRAIPASDEAFADWLRPSSRGHWKEIDYEDMSPAQRISYWADANGITEEEFRTRVESKLQKIVDKMDVRVRMHAGTVEKLLADGRFKSQFESFTSSGVLDNDVRMKAEKMLFDLSEKTQGHLRPIYGYLSPSETGFGPADWSRQLDHYGDVSFKLRHGARNRAFMTLDDSLMGIEGDIPQTLPSQINQVRIHSYMMDRASSNPLEILEGGVESLHRTFNFMEAQIGMGVNITDIEVATFRDMKEFAKYRRVLMEKGIRSELTSGAGEKIIQEYGTAELAAEKAAEAAKQLEHTRYGKIIKAAESAEAEIEKLTQEIHARREESKPLRQRVWGSGPDSWKFRSPEWEVGNAELQAYDESTYALTAQRKKVEETLEQDIKKLLRREKEEALQLQWQIESEGQASLEFRDKVQEGIEEFCALVSNDTIHSTQQQVTIKYLPQVKVKGKMEVARAFYREEETAAYLAEGDWRQQLVTVHELGHWIEHRSSQVRQAANDFLRKRTSSAGGVRQELTRIYPRAKPGTAQAKEMGWKDKFMDHYAGKYYQWGSTEIISMGMQWLRDCPLRFYREDREYFELMMKVVGNAPW